MLIALLAAQRSPDPNTQVGACIVDNKNRILGTGYNGAPRGVPACYVPWDREAETYNLTKYAYVVHAEKNAIANCTHRPENSTLYVTMHPCNECTKDILQAGIKYIWYLTNPYIDKPETKAAVKMLDLAGVFAYPFQWKSKELARTVLQNLLPGA